MLAFLILSDLNPILFSFLPNIIDTNLREYVITDDQEGLSTAASPELIQLCTSTLNQDIFSSFEALEHIMFAPRILMCLIRQPSVSPTDSAVYLDRLDRILDYSPNLIDVIVAKMAELMNYDRWTQFCSAQRMKLYGPVRRGGLTEVLYAGKALVDLISECTYGPIVP